jgi:Lrp/AsnC family transcriptional regulator
MDQIDRKILTELQRDATLPIAALAARVGLSQTPCWKRVQKLEAAGIITARVAVVDPAKVGLGLTVLMDVEAMDHTAEWRAAFLAALDAIPEVMEVLRLGGTSDYQIRIVVPDMPAYDAIYLALTDAVSMRAVTSRFVMETLRKRPDLPLRPDPPALAKPLRVAAVAGVRSTVGSRLRAAPASAVSRAGPRAP